MLILSITHQLMAGAIQSYAARYVSVFDGQICRPGNPSGVSDKNRIKMLVSEAKVKTNELHIKYIDIRALATEDLQEHGSQQ